MTGRDEQRPADNPAQMSEFRFDFDFLKSRYDYELQRKEQLTTALKRTTNGADY